MTLKEQLIPAIKEASERIFGNPEKGYEKPQASLRSMMQQFSIW